ncbi:FeoA family protein [Leptodesmis sichuanensis]|uniref:FeoA family protein n=1 Tax=Leptodesmis sichuanensis TaxID=2906798 RepID=UPI001F22FBFA|nr:FeoA family protein [Leptodesmis sichuanensis]UIE38055.1 ferrous iron transport protein A [Leptodesmis sichuanensis A121]
MPGRFTVSGSTLSLLNAGERGVVTRVTSADRRMVQKLLAMGVVPGTMVTLEQRSPRYRIKVNEHQFIIGYDTAQAIYVRLTETFPAPRFWSLPGLVQITTNWLKCLALKPTHSTLQHQAPSQSVVP